MQERIVQISQETGIPTKKMLDFLFALRTGKPVENNKLLQAVGISKNALNQAKGLLSFILKPSSKSTQLEEGALPEVGSLFMSGYQPEEILWNIFENESYRNSIKILEKCTDQRPSPKREYDQFTATAETTARRAGLLNFFEDVADKKVLFLGDDDFTSVAIASCHAASKVSVLDVDNRILDGIAFISREENLGIATGNYDVRRPLPASYSGKFDVVFTDPPYTIEGIRLFVSRAIQALNPSNKAARMYVCYGNSDKAKERFLPIYEVFNSSGLMIRWAFDKFNRYQGAESIGSASTLFVLDVTSKTKPLITKNYDKPIYTNN